MLMIYYSDIYRYFLFITKKYLKYLLVFYYLPNFIHSLKKNEPLFSLGSELVPKDFGETAVNQH